MGNVNNLSIGILAGGKSSRMGQNKALLQINNESIIKKLTKDANLEQLKSMLTKK